MPTLISILKESVRLYGDRPALLMRPRWRTISWTYQELWQITKKIGRLLEELSVGKGDRVIIISNNSPWWTAIFWAVQFKGAVAVPLNPAGTIDFFKRVIDQTEAKVIFKSLAIALPKLSGVKVIELETLPEILGKTPEEGKEVKVAAEELAEIVYTSGTTGAPKGVMLTHQNIYSNVKTISQLIPIAPNDKFLSILPLFHMFEQTLGMILPISRGSQIIYLPNLGSGTIANALREHQITKMLAVPEFLKKIMDRIEGEAARQGRLSSLSWLFSFSLALPLPFRRIIFSKIHRRFGGKLKTVASGGAPLDPQLEKKWLALGVHLLQGYGLTETSPVISTNTYKDHRIGSVGKAISGVRVKIAQDGEILVKGPNVFPGYYKNPEKTKQVFTDRWFKTDDQGRMDGDDFFYVYGRKTYMILGPAGQNIFPEDIEGELNKIEGVKDSAVLGIKKDGKTIIHAVILSDEKNLEAVVKKANAGLAPYQQIQEWSRWPGVDFPRSATRKVRKGEVIKWLEERKEVPLAGEIKGELTPLTRLLGEVTGTDPLKISLNTKLVQDLKLDSLSRIELVTRIEEEFGSVVEERFITPKTTVKSLEELVEKGRGKGIVFPFKRWPLSLFFMGLRWLLQHGILFPLIRLFVKVQARGQENLKSSGGPIILMANHLSYLDSPVILRALPFWMRGRLAIAAAVDVLYQTYRYAAWFIEALVNSYPFPRKEEENIKAGLDYTGRLLDLGWSILIYPEGRMSLDGKLQPLKRGAGLLGTEMDAPVVPVFIEGTDEILPPGKIWPRRRGRAVVIFGKPVRFKMTDSYIEVTNEIEKELASLRDVS